MVTVWVESRLPSTRYKSLPSRALWSTDIQLTTLRTLSIAATECRPAASRLEDSRGSWMCIGRGQVRCPEWSQRPKSGEETEDNEGTEAAAPEEIVKKLRDAAAMLDAGHDEAAMPQALGVSGPSNSVTR